MKCNRSKVSIEELVLYLFRSDGIGSILQLKLSDGSEIVVEKLAPRLVLLLLILDEYRKAQKHNCVEAVGGWLTNDQLMTRYRAKNDSTFLDDPNSIGAYRSRINRAVRAADTSSNRKKRELSVFQNNPGRGVRLIKELTIIEMNQQ